VLGVAHLKDLVELVRDDKADLRRICAPVLQSPSASASSSS
jgi:hypothetical protein